MKILDVNELFELSDKASEPKEVELIEGVGVKFRPMAFPQAVKMISGYRKMAANPESRDDFFVDYFIETFVEGIVEPVMNDIQKAQFKKKMITWPNDIVQRIMAQIYEESGLKGGAIEEQIEEVDNFFEEKTDSEEPLA